jgi:hypothetical protein
MTILIPTISRPKPGGYHGKKKSRQAAEDDNEDNHEDNFPEIPRASGDRRRGEQSDDDDDDDLEAQAPPSRHVTGKRFNPWATLAPPDLLKAISATVLDISR